MALRIVERLTLKRTCHVCKGVHDKNAGSRVPAGRYQKDGITYTFSVAVWVCDFCQGEMTK